MVKKFGNIIGLFIILISIISGIIVASVASVEYSSLFLLPITFAICSVLFGKIYGLLGKSVVYTCIIGMGVLKYILIPLFMALGDGGFQAVVNTEPYMLFAVILQCYELVILMVILFCMYGSVTKSLLNNIQNEITFNKKSIDTFSRFTFIILFFILIILIIYPILKVHFNIGIIGNEVKIIENVRIKSEMKESVPVIIYYAYIFFANLLQWLIPLTLIFKLYISKFSERKKTIISLLGIVLVSILTIDTKAISIFIFLSLALVVLKLYKSQRKIIIRSTIIFIGLFGVVGLFVKSFGSNFGNVMTITKLANMLQAYFSGPENVAVSLAIDTSVTLEEYVGNIFCFIPYIMFFFKNYTNSNVLFNQTFWGTTDIQTQIIPTLGQCARCLTPVLAPTFTIIIVLLAIKQEKKLHRSNSLFKIATSYICCIFLALAWAMYNMSLCLQVFLNYLFPILFFLWLSTKIVFNFVKR